MSCPKRERFLKSITAVYIMSMFTFFLIFTGNEGYSAIFRAKTTAFTVASLAYLLPVIAVRASMGKPRLSHPSQVFALIYLAVTVLSALLSPYFPKTLTGISRFEGLFTIAVYILLFLFVSAYGDIRKWFAPVLAAVAFVMSLIVMIQLLGFNALLLYPDGDNYYSALEKYNGAFISTVGNADISSAFFSLVTLILFALAILKKQGRWLYIVSFVMSASALLHMSVSAGVVAFAVSVAIAPAVIFQKIRKKYLIALAIAAVAFLVVVFLVEMGDGALADLHGILRGDLDKTYGAGRIHIWSEVLGRVGKNFWLGSGPDTMLYAELAPFTRVLENGEIIVRKIDVAHNEYLNVLFHQGFFAFVSYLCMIGSVLLSCFRSGSKSVALSALGLGLFAYSVQVFFSFSACSSATLFWICMGLAVSELKRIKETS